MTLIKQKGAYFTDVYHKSDADEMNISLNERDKLNINIRLEGIVIFGGFNSLDIATNRVLFLVIGSNPVILTEIQTKGKGPDPRGFHTAIYLKHLGYLAIHGGRNDANFARNGEISYNDMA
jgi:hypothetical protein